ncbi:MAG: beta-aspartyl-peptidase [Phycisphaerae bacterium]|nr:beta-aspartyl-peptidase [Phycisphaerae bacterium]|tara:strand:+ start:2307 stop:3200 length:894 start_codon:yes stop_codon:yes gene_type:complete
MRNWAVAIHGGAGVIGRSMDPSMASVRMNHLEMVIRHASERAEQGQSAVDLVEQAVIELEEIPEFNAGRGAVLTADGKHELEAAIMDGSRAACGGACLLRNIRNPIRLARRVMEQSPHVLLAGEAAESMGMDLDRVENDWFTTSLRKEQWESWAATKREADARGPATVGAVARDQAGNLAAATSTGGRTGKPPGRIGDTPTIGAGTWADQTCAISGTGHGEAFMAAVTGHAVSARMRHLNEPLAEAASVIIHQEMPAGSGGLIAVDGSGRLAMPYNCEGMYRAAADSSGHLEIAIWD